MARKKPGQNLRSGKSVNVSIHETTPVPKDGPEEYTEDSSIRRSEDGKIKAPYANSASTSRASKAKNYRKRETVTGRLGRRTFQKSPRTVNRDLVLKSSQFGSPFAYSPYQNKQDFFKGLLAESTRVLFDQVVAETSTLRERLSPGVALTNDGSNGQFCVFKKCEIAGIDSDSREESNSENSKLGLYCFESDEDKSKLAFFVDPTSAALHRTYVVRNGLVGSNDSSDPSSTRSKNSKDDKIIDIRRVRNSQSGEIEYFVINIGLDFLSINGIVVDSTVRAGPLPDFAVLESGHSSIFWWRTAAALDYMPSLKRKRVSVETDENSSRKAFKGDTDPLSSSKVFPESKNWLDEYRHRVRLCEERPIEYTTSITDLHPPHQLPNGEMRDIDVILAIGAVWLGLIHAKIDFAYANSDLFSIARGMRMVGMYAVKGSNHFIMPLLFNEEFQALSPESEEDTAEPLEPVFSAFQRGEEEKNHENFTAAEKAKQKDPGNENKPSLSLEDQEQTQNHNGDIGHFVLAIAEKVNRDKFGAIKDTLAKKKALVRLRFMDSAEGNVDKTIIRRVARNVVRHSGWLDDTWPCFDANEEHWAEVLRQSGNRCGEHTVMNAWAHMLGITLATTRERGLGYSFYKEVRKMILLALRGQLDSLTIRAWMQHSKYAVDEPLSQLQQTQIQKPDSPNRLKNMQTVALNEDGFNEIVREIHTHEQITNQTHVTISGAVSVPLDDATTQQSAHTPTIPTSPASSQGSIAGPSGISSISGGSTGPANITPVPQASRPSPRTWRQSLDQGLAYHYALKAKNPRTTQDTRKMASIINKSSNMADYDVVMGIAPVWEGLKRLGRAEFDFAYAGMDVLVPGGSQQGVGVVGGRSRFIMPLFLSSIRAEALEDQGKGKKKIQQVGHLVLCVVELVDDHPMTVQVQIADSSPRTVHPHEVAREALKMVRDSGWLGVGGSVTGVKFRTCLRIPVPHQVGINTCGLHVILNAWAIMLGIPIHRGPLRREPSGENENDATDHNFLRQGLEIVNLALEGFMDSATIQAFFNVYGYSVEQRFGDPARAVIPVNAVGMNQDKFRRTLQKRHWIGMIASAEAKGTTFPDADIAYLFEQGLNEREAWRAMSISGGDREGAARWHYEQVRDGELPKPEEALSPKTPDRGERS